MLLGDVKSEVKSVALVTRNPKFNKLLGSILAEWKFLSCGELSAAKVVLAERGLELPAHDGHVVWLSSMPLPEGSFLTVPVSLSDLYHLLEVHFYTTPRRHLRLAIQTPVALGLENGWQEGQLLSLSARGGRIACSSDIPLGQPLEIELKLAGRVLRISSKVLYRIPAGDFPGRLQPQIGVLFRPSDQREPRFLKGFIEKVYIERACEREGISLKDLCVSWFEVPTDPWGAAHGLSAESLVK